MHSVTVCFEGPEICALPGSRDRLRETEKRIRFLRTILRVMENRWSKIDVIVFPGGFIYNGDNIGPQPYPSRVQSLVKAGIVQPIVEALGDLTSSPNALLAIGVDGKDYRDGTIRDQLCVAIQTTGIVGIGRKIFPTDAEASNLVCYESDYGDPKRVVVLPSGATAVLCACYDMFGVADLGDTRSPRARKIRIVGSQGRKIIRGQTSFRQSLIANLTNFENLLSNKGASVAISTIHYFSSSAVIFWQKHGIAPASAALGGGLAIAAANFGRLPILATSSTLASNAVPPLTEGNKLKRTAHSYVPTDYFYFYDSNGAALVRYFE